MDTALRDEIEFSLHDIVDFYIKNGVFSACSIAVTYGVSGTFRRGNFNYGTTGVQSGVEVDGETVFDLASLTKPLVITLSILALVEKGVLRLDDYVSKYIDLTGVGSNHIKIIHLLEHSSGFVAHREYFHTLNSFPQSVRKIELLSTIRKEDTVTTPGEVGLYSDLGYILLGAIVEKISGMTLDNFWKREIIAPLELEKDLFFAGNEKTKARVFSSTGICQWSNKELLGLVNDDNCRSIGGVAGHAGLFGTANAVVTVIEMLLKMYEGRNSHPGLSFTSVRKRLQDSHDRWVMGFDTPTGENSSSGRYFSKETLGHLGFTGTSFWMDCRQKVGIVLLTNRVLCSEDLKGIRSFRPKVHDLIMEKLTGVEK